MYESDKLTVEALNKIAKQGERIADYLETICEHICPELHLEKEKIRREYKGNGLADFID